MQPLALSRINNLLFIILLSFTLYACGPRYQTFTSYSPPTVVDGDKCISKCLSIKNKCDNNCQLQKSSCSSLEEQRAQNDYNSYIQTQCYYVNGTNSATISDSYQRNIFDQNSVVALNSSKGYSQKLECEGGRPKTIENFRYRYRCTNQYSNCLFGCSAVYDSCYEACGGIITRTTVCVANCDKIPTNLGNKKP
jgi:hypothetical protein